MIEILLAAGVAALILNTIFNVVYVFTIKRTSRELREFVMKIEPNLNQTVSEFRGTVENMRKISNDVREVTADVKRVSHAVADIEKGIRSGVEYAEQALSSAVDEDIAALKSGVAAGLTTLVQKAVTGKERSS